MSYPIHGLCRIDHPETRLDAAKIAWGGVIAQFLLALPAIGRLAVWGYSNVGPLNTALAICGPTSIAIALFNLLPIKPLDGATAWSLFWLLWAERKRAKQTEKSALQIFQELAEKKRKLR